MTWVRIDDAAPLHPKLLRAGAEAAWLWVAGMAHCNRHTTDGRIDDAALPSLYPCDGWGRAKIRRLAERLVEVGLWHREADGYRVHDYEHYQEEAMRDAVEERRAYERERKRKQRQAKKRQRESSDSERLANMSRRDSEGHVPGTSPGQSSGHPAGQSQGHGAGHPPGHVHGQGGGRAPGVSQPPGPAQPVPSRPDPTEEQSSAARARELGPAARELTPDEQDASDIQPGDVLQVCPDCGSPVVVKHGKHGLWAACTAPSCGYKVSRLSGRRPLHGRRGAAEEPPADPLVEELAQIRQELFDCDPADAARKQALVDRREQIITELQRRKRRAARPPATGAPARGGDVVPIGDVAREVTRDG